MSSRGLQSRRKVRRYGAGDAQLHETAPQMVAALCDVDWWLQGRRVLMDPACGPGEIVRVLQLFNHATIAADLHDYSDRYKAKTGAAYPVQWGRDFFSWTVDQVRALYRAASDFAIVMNPPYGTGEVGELSMAARFVRHALNLADRVYALLSSDFVHAGAGCPLRDELIDTEMLTGIFPFRERPTLHRDDFEGERKRGVINYTWFRWERRGGDRVWQRLSIEQGGRACVVSTI